jgi:hypothetical protein
VGVKEDEPWGQKNQTISKVDTVKLAIALQHMTSTTPPRHPKKRTLKQNARTYKRKRTLNTTQHTHTQVALPRPARPALQPQQTCYISQGRQGTELGFQDFQHDSVTHNHKFDEDRFVILFYYCTTYCYNL